MINPAVNGDVEFIEGWSDGRVARWSIREDGSEARAEDARGGSGEEEGGAQAGRRDAVPVGAREPLDEAVHAQAPEVVCHAARGDLAGIDAQQGREVFAHVAVGEATRQQTKQDQGAEEGLHTRSGEG